MAPDAVRERVSAVRLDTPAVLAVSGGADSMVMAAHLLEVCPHNVAVIATFDHGTGSAATEAAARVTRWADAHGMTVRVGRATGLQPTEAAWRSARWAFLRGVSDEFAVPVATGHTEDDQAETVFIRLLRHSGVRGLAGLRAPGPVLRPMLGVSRADVREFAVATGVPFADDPSNRSLRFLRNRVRCELLPALEAVQPGFREWLLSIGREAAQWRSDVAAAVDACWAPVVQGERRTIVVPRDRRRLPDADEAALFWPEVAGRIGLALDRRGTARLASFTTKADTGLQMPLSVGGTVYSRRDAWTLERVDEDRAERLPPERLAPRGH
jgi:tRNA(Ile)-lysidine synthetase-like protein